jgi:hypothetical protein
LSKTQAGRDLCLTSNLSKGIEEDLMQFFPRLSGMVQHTRVDQILELWIDLMTTFSISPRNFPSVGMLPEQPCPTKLPERILFCGWRRDMDDMIQVLDSFLPLGSELWLFSEVPVEDREERLKEGGLDPANLKNVMLVHKKGNPVNRRHLELLPLEDFDSVGGRVTRAK